MNSKAILARVDMSDTDLSNVNLDEAELYNMPVNLFNAYNHNLA
ncbi:MAG: pentapeptide repeat-containing protein [Nostocales cyanobacterium 94392]|nr:pentapeptide repeat-containing protein [Nostocales cyanobacterium 94392]